MGVKLLSLDIWDTVLRRRCHPDESKFGVAKYILLKYYTLLKNEFKTALPHDLVKIRYLCEHNLAIGNREKELDDEYQIYEVFDLWIEKIMVELIDKKKSILLDELIAIELNHEMYISYMDPEICKRIKKNQYDKLIYISDFYMNKQHIDELINRYADQIQFDGGFVSSDYNVNKKSGRLFYEAQKGYGVVPKKHTHIGDNRLSDFKCPRKLDIQAQRYLPFKQHILQYTHKVNYYLRSKINQKFAKKLFGHFKKVNAELKNIKTNDIYVDLGIEHAFYFVMYIVAVIEAAIREDVDKIYYFTREGEFFKQIHDAIEQADVFGFPIPKSELLEVSRMATYGPSIQEISIDGMMRLWAEYPNQSLDAFFKSLNINIEEYRSYLIKHELHDIHQPLNEIYKHKTIVDLFQDDMFIQEIDIEIKKKRRLFLKYLDQKGIYTNIEKIFVVDIGWRGSIQDNIALLFPNTEVVGFYMGLFRPYYKKIPNSRKIGFVSSNNKENYLWYFRHPYSLEVYTNSNNGSVVGYIETPDSKIKAIRNNYNKEDIVYDKYVKRYQQGIILTIPILGQMIRTYSFLTDELTTYTMESLKKFVVYPNKKLTKPYFELVYNSVYGMGKMEVMKRKIGVKLIVKSLISPNKIKKLINFIEDSHWPNGLFMSYHLFIVNWFYNKLAKRMYDYYSCIHPLKCSNRIKLSVVSFQNINANIFYEREEVVVDYNCLYIRGNVVIPEELMDEYKILIKLEEKNKSCFFETFELVKNTQGAKRHVCFEVKIRLSESIDKSQPCIIILNRKKLLYAELKEY